MYCVFKVKGGNKAALIVAAVLLAAAIIISLLIPEQESVSETQPIPGTILWLSTRDMAV